MVLHLPRIARLVCSTDVWFRAPRLFRHQWGARRRGHLAPDSAATRDRTAILHNWGRRGDGSEAKKEKDKTTFWYPTWMPQTPQAGTGDSVGWFCCDWWSSLINYGSNLYMFGTFLTVFLTWFSTVFLSWLLTVFLSWLSRLSFLLDYQLSFFSDYWPSFFLDYQESATHDMIIKKVPQILVVRVIGIENWFSPRTFYS